MILTSLRLNYPFFKKYKLNCRISSQMLKKKLIKNLRIALKFPKSGKNRDFLAILEQFLGFYQSFFQHLA